MRRAATQFAVAATVHSTLSSDDVKSAEIRSRAKFDGRYVGIVFSRTTVVVQ